jgi:hypothetical protein
MNRDPRIDPAKGDIIRKGETTREVVGGGCVVQFNAFASTGGVMQRGFAVQPVLNESTLEELRAKVDAGTVWQDWAQGAEVVRTESNARHPRVNPKPGDVLIGSGKEWREVTEIGDNRSPDCVSFVEAPHEKWRDEAARVPGKVTYQEWIEWAAKAGVVICI